MWFHIGSSGLFVKTKFHVADNRHHPHCLCWQGQWGARNLAKVFTWQHSACELNSHQCKLIIMPPSVLCWKIQVSSFAQLCDVIGVDWSLEENATKLRKTPKTYFIIRSECRSYVLVFILCLILDFCTWLTYSLLAFKSFNIPVDSWFCITLDAKCHILPSYFGSYW